MSTLVIDAVNEITNTRKIVTGIESIREGFRELGLEVHVSTTGRGGSKEMIDALAGKFGKKARHSELKDCHGGRIDLGGADVCIFYPKE